jgi:hypothetical protein
MILQRDGSAEQILGKLVSGSQSNKIGAKVSFILSGT